MAKEIFRQASLDRVKSPEQLNEYIRVSKPSIWLVLAAVLVLLTGALVWGTVGRLETTVSAVAIMEEGQAYLLLRAEDAGKIAKGMAVRAGSETGETQSLSEPFQITQDFDGYAMHLGHFQAGDWVCQAGIDIKGLTSAQAAVVVTDSVSPLSFVLN